MQKKLFFPKFKFVHLMNLLKLLQWFLKSKVSDMYFTTEEFKLQADIYWWIMKLWNQFLRSQEHLKTIIYVKYTYVNVYIHIHKTYNAICLNKIFHKPLSTLITRKTLSYILFVFCSISWFLKCFHDLANWFLYIYILVCVLGYDVKTNSYSKSW